MDTINGHDTSGFFDTQGGIMLADKVRDGTSTYIPEDKSLMVLAGLSLRQVPMRKSRGQIHRWKSTGSSPEVDCPRTRIEQEDRWY